MTPDADDWIVRPVRTSDLHDVGELAAALGPGMTTLPNDRDTLSRKIAVSVETFGAPPQQAPNDAQYLLVLESISSARVLGIAGIYPSIGHPHGFFSYRRSRRPTEGANGEHDPASEWLDFSLAYTGATEVGTLAVQPSLRGSGAGRLLARCRYLLIGAFPDRFAEVVMAEMRGWQDEDGRSPFWDAVGLEIFGMEFAEADHRSATQGGADIAERFPRNALPVADLPERARSIIGRPHASSAAAMKLLIDEGFRSEDMVDIFDAGPQLSARRGDIATIVQMESGVMRPQHLDGGRRVLALGARAMGHARFGYALVDIDASGIGMTSRFSDKLGLHPGDVVHFVPG